MDQDTWGVLIAAGIGVVGVVVAAVLTPWLTARRAESARLRDERREAYSHGMRAVAEVPRARDIGQAVFESQAQISLVGSDRARDRYTARSEVVRSIVDSADAETSKVRFLVNTNKRLELAFPPDLRKGVAGPLPRVPECGTGRPWRQE